MFIGDFVWTAGWPW